MTGPVRILVAALAILSTLLTAGVVGAARGQAMAAGEIVICAGGGAVTLAVDAEGNPTGPAHWCPDCVLALLSAVSPVDVAVVAPGAAPGASGLSVARLLAGPASGAAQARAPPRV